MHMDPVSSSKLTPTIITQKEPSCAKVQELIKAVPGYDSLKTPQRRQALDAAYQEAHRALAELKGNAFIAPPKELAFQLVDIIRDYGRTIYGDAGVKNTWHTSREFLLLAYEIQLYALGQIDHIHDLEHLPSLEAIRVDLEQEDPKLRKHSFFDIDALVQKADHKVLLEKVCVAQLTPQQIEIFSFLLRYLNATYIRTNPSEMTEEQNAVDLKRDTAFCELALAIHGLTTETEQELDHLRYNDLPRFYKRIGRPDLVDQNWRAVEERALRINDVERLKMVYSKMALATEDPEKRSKLFLKARQIYQSTGVKNPCLYANFLSNQAFYLMDISPADAQGLLNESYAIVKSLRAQGVETSDFRYPTVNYIKIKLRLNKLDEAREAIDANFRAIAKETEDQKIKEVMHLLDAQWHLEKGKTLFLKEALEVFKITQKLCEQYRDSKEFKQLYDALKAALQEKIKTAAPPPAATNNK